MNEFLDTPILTKKFISNFYNFFIMKDKKYIDIKGAIEGIL